MIPPKQVGEEWEKFRGHIRVEHNEPMPEPSKRSHHDLKYWHSVGKHRRAERRRLAKLNKGKT